MEISQAEADHLFNTKKRRVDEVPVAFPGLGGKVTAQLLSLDGRESFQLDISRGRISLVKRTYQNRARGVLVLARLDFGPPHRNPDGVEIGSPHLHVYREGFGDTWAFAVPVDQFPDLDDLMGALNNFMAYCNVVEPPIFNETLPL